MPAIFSTPAATGAPSAYDGLDRMLLTGRWTHGGSGQSVEDVDPYTNEVLLGIPLADQGDLDDAFEAAAAAQPAWSRGAACNAGGRAETRRRDHGIATCRDHRTRGIDGFENRSIWRSASVSDAATVPLDTGGSTMRSRKAACIAFASLEDV